ncbi:hypothetical protein PENTCL1PPCAC_28803, partial [Pristionchus entomophagus]
AESEDCRVHRLGCDQTERWKIFKTITTSRLRLLLGLITMESSSTMKDVEAIIERSQKLEDVIVSFSLKNLEFRDGSKLKDAIDLMMNCENIVGFGINCSDPKNGESQREEIVRRGWTNAGKHIFIYPYSGEEYVDG